MTFTSCSASSLAAISPEGPPPTMITSLSVKSMNSSLNSSVIARVTSASPALLKPLNSDSDIPPRNIFLWYKLVAVGGRRTETVVVGRFQAGYVYVTAANAFAPPSRCTITHEHACRRQVANRYLPGD